MKQEHQMGSLISCVDEFQQQACAQRLELEDAYHGYVHLEENNFAHKKHYL